MFCANKRESFIAKHLRTCMNTGNLKHLISSKLIPMSCFRILIAEEQNVIHEAAKILGEKYELVLATKLKEAKRLCIETGIDLFVIGIHFDDSRAMELVKLIRLGEMHAKAPVIIVRMSPTDHDRLLRQTIDHMIRVGAVSDYIESAEKDKENEDRNFAAQLREAVARNLVEARTH